MSVLIASIAIGLVLGWACVPRPQAVQQYWLLAFVGFTLVLFGATFVSALVLSPALGGGATGFSIHALWRGALAQRRRS